MRTRDLDALMGIAAMPKWLTDQLAEQATLAESVAAGVGASLAGLNSFRHEALTTSRWAQDIADQYQDVFEHGNDQLAEQAKLAESVAASVGASLAGLDSFRHEALMTSRWAQDIADQCQDVFEHGKKQAALYDSVRSTLEAQLSGHLAIYSKLLPEWKAMDWSVIDSPLLRQMADQARRQIEFFDQLGLMSPEAAAQSEIFCPTLELPIAAPQHADPEPVLAEFVEAQGEAQLTLGKLALGQGMWVEAESHLKKAAKWLEHSAEPRVGLGFALNAQGKHERAVKAFESAERRDSVCFSRPDVRAAYEASLQGRRWDGQLDSDSPKEN